MLRRREVLHKKGFTLVEVIVVLVILAILGTMTVPALTGQLRSGQEKKAVTEAQACVAAATDLAAQKYTAARTDYLNNNTKPIAAALNAWAGTVQDDGPEVTGDLILTEGTGQYLLEPTNADTGAAVGNSSIKQAAGVDGTVLNFWCNANGQVVYLLYKSADGITVAYTNRATSGSSSVVIPTANVPTAVPGPTPTKKPDSGTDTPTPVPTKKPATDTPTPVPTVTPTATPTVINGPKLIIHLEDATNGSDVPLGNYFLIPEINGVKDYDHKLSVSADANGNIEVGLLPQNNNNVLDSFSPDYMKQPSLIAYVPFTLEEESAPAGYQALNADNKFNVQLDTTDHTDSNYQWVIDTISLKTLYINSFVNGEYQTTTDGQTTLHIRRYPIASLDIKKVDYNSNRLGGATLRLSTASQNNTPGETIVEVPSSKTSPQDIHIPVKLHDGDNLGTYTGPYIDLTSIYSKSFILTEVQTPSGDYRNAGSQAFTVSRGGVVYTRDDAFDIKVSTDSWSQFYRYSSASKSLKHTIDVINYPSKCKVTINKVDDKLSPVSGAKFNIVDNNGAPVYQTTSTTTLPASFTVELAPGNYTLKETAVPDKKNSKGNYLYAQASDIPFTVGENEFEKTVTMIDHQVLDDSKDAPTVTIPDSNISITFSKAVNWANKITQDNLVNYHREVIYWHGVNYFCLMKIDNVKNPFKDYWADGHLDLDSTYDSNGTPYQYRDTSTVIAPDPIGFYKNFYPQAKPDFCPVIALTGKIWDRKTNVSSITTVNPIKQGDLFVSQTATGTDRVYIYFGTSPLTSAPATDPSEDKNNPENSQWALLDSSKVKVVRTSS